MKGIKMNTITRWFVYAKPETGKRYKHVAVFNNKEEAMKESTKYKDAFIQGVDDCGKNETERIYIK